MTLWQRILEFFGLGRKGDGDVVTVHPKVATLDVTPKVTDMTEGDTVQLAIVAKDPRGNAVPVTPKSSDTKVLTVTPAGLLTAVAPGQAAITVDDARGKSYPLL